MEKTKKVIMIISYFYDLLDTNALCLDYIIRHLAEKGFQVHVLCCHPKPAKLQEFDNKKGIYIHTIPSFKFKLDRIMDKTRNKCILIRILGKAFRLINYYFSSKTSPMVYSSTIHFAKGLIIQNKITNILSISAPFANHELAKILKGAFNKIKWTVYQFDPHTYNYHLDEIERNKRMDEERKILAAADKVILTDGIQAENRRMGFAREFDHKTISVPLPNLLLNNEVSQGGTLQISTDSIILLYTGNIYGSIRNPDILFKILSRINTLDIVLHIYGTGLENLAQQYSLGGGQVVLHSRVPKTEVLAAMENASILVNFGNSMINQLPSKVFDYIASGKPIINFCKDDNDSSLYYLLRYPAFLNIYDDEALSETAIRRFEEFCRKYKRFLVSRKEIAGLYKDLLSENVCERIENFVSY